MLEWDNQPCSISLAIRDTWTHLTTTFHDIRTPTQTANKKSYLLMQEVQQAGFYQEGTQPSSVTRAITTEIETERGEKLTKQVLQTLSRSDYEQQAYLNCSKMSLVFLHFPPDHIGYMENKPFCMGFERCLGQACPIIAPMVGRYFGRNRKRLDTYEINLSADTLPGRGHRSLQDQLKHLILYLHLQRS